MSYIGRDFSPTDSPEVEIYALDFGPILADGEVLLTAEVTIATVGGTGVDTAPSVHLVGPAIINGTIVSQMIGPLVPNCVYRVLALVTTSLGQTLELYSRVFCQDPS